MPLTLRFCNQCAAPIERRPVEDRMREVCPSCGTVFYQNPLPVASAVVLDEQRRVLLVKRKNDPYRGMWCLPIGFAELDESVAGAALRELEEETGIRGEVRRLRGAESFESDDYGQILVVTFEVKRTGGEERAGDDAEALDWFPLDGLPPLAFEPNERAIRACAVAHRDEWAIQDSFRDLQAGEEGELLSDALVRFISESAEKVADRWLEDVTTNPTTPSYRRVERKRLRDGAVAALSQLSQWLAGEEKVRRQVRRFYRAVGDEHRRRGMPLHELISSFALFRKHLWTFARSEGVWERPIDLYRALELDMRVIVFFDRAAYHAVRGYQQVDGASHA